MSSAPDENIIEAALLKDNSSFVSAVLDTIGSLVLVLDRRGKIVLFNRACEEVTGYSFEEVRGRYVWDFLLLPDEVGPVKEVFRDLQAGIFPNKFENSWIAKDGRRMLISWSNTALLGPSGQVEFVIPTGIDITEQRRTEEALKTTLAGAEEEKMKTQALIAAMGDGISIQDTEFKVLYQNRVHKDLIGNHEGEYCFRGYQRKEKVCEGCPLRMSFQDGEIHTAERSASTDRGTVHVEVTASPVRGPDGRIVAGIEIARDMTTRKKAEDKLKLFSEAIEEAMDGIQIVDLDGRIVYSNKAVEEIYGFRPEELAGRDINEMNADPEFARRVILPCIREKGRWNGELTVLHKTGREFPIWLSSSLVRDEKGTPIAMIGVIRDITKRKQAEEEIRRNYDTGNAINSILRVSTEDLSLKEILERALDLILSIPWLTLESKGGIFLADDSRANLQMKGQKGLDDQVLRECTTVPFGKCLCGRAARSKQVVFADTIDQRHEVMYKGITPHGHYCVPILFSDSLLGVLVLYLREGHREDAKEIEFLSAIANSLAGVIQRKKMEEEKEMSERLASLGRMASGIAHEINNPLAAIAGCSEGLLGRIRKDKFEAALFSNYLGIIKEEVMRCKNITTGMLSFVREGIYEKRDLDINETIEKALEIVGYQGRLKAVEVRRRYGDLPPVNASEGELRQVFLAVITNAVDAMEEKGLLVIETGRGERSVFVKIADSGPGIDPAHITRIFDPFFTTKAATGGTGLGLSISHKIIANHGGTIQASGQRDGAVFTISLPC